MNETNPKAKAGGALSDELRIAAERAVAAFHDEEDECSPRMFAAMFDLELHLKVATKPPEAGAPSAEPTEALNKKERMELELRRAQMSRFPFCSDHRDKVKGLSCRQCEIERLTAALARKPSAPPEAGAPSVEAQLRKERDDWKDRDHLTGEERDGWKARALALHAAQDKEVWYWQGDGSDFPESLVCPVVMPAATLRELLAARKPSAPPEAGAPSAERDAMRYRVLREGRHLHLPTMTDPLDDQRQFLPEGLDRVCDEAIALEAGPSATPQAGGDESMLRALREARKFIYWHGDGSPAPTQRDIDALIALLDSAVQVATAKPSAPPEAGGAEPEPAKALHSLVYKLRSAIRDDCGAGAPRGAFEAALKAESDLLAALDHALAERSKSLSPAASGTDEAKPEDFDTNAVIRSLGAALRDLSFHAQTTGGTAGPDAALKASIARAQHAVSLVGLAEAGIPAREAGGAELREALRDAIEGFEEHVPFVQGSLLDITVKKWKRILDAASKPSAGERDD